MTLAWSAYRAAAPLLGALAPAARVFASPRERALWSERMGEVDRPGGCHAWVHGASLGEANAVLPLVAELARLQHEARFHLSATTRTGRARLQAAGHPVTLAPIDSPQAVRRFFRGVSPARLFVVETEIWPHWWMRARLEGVPVAVVSARLSDRSVRGYHRLGAPLRELVSGLAAVLCQTGEDARRWLELGADPARTEVVGNLKNDALPEPAASRPAARMALALDPARPLLVLGSVRPGEGRLLAAAWRSLPPGTRARWQVVALPRHVRAAAELRGEIRHAGVAVADGPLPEGEAWGWEERSGVLNRYYQAADLAFVGGSLMPYGGHNPLEPAACGAPVLIGSHHSHQLEAVRALEIAGGIRIVSEEFPLEGSLAAWTSDDGSRAAAGEAARQAVAKLRGGARRAALRLAAWGLWPAA